MTKEIPSKQGEWVPATNAEGLAKTLVPANTLKLRVLPIDSDPEIQKIAQSAENNFFNFAKNESFRKNNRTLLEKSFAATHTSDGRSKHLDVGGGTGAIIEEGIKISKKNGEERDFVMIEPDKFAIQTAYENIPASDNGNVVFIRGLGQEVESLIEQEFTDFQGFDSASFHDGLHEVRGLVNKREVLLNMKKVMKEGATLSINTQFTTVSMEDRRYGIWKLGAVNRSRGKRIKEPKADAAERARQKSTYKGDVNNVDLSVIDRDETKTEILTPEEFIALLTFPESRGGAGFELVISYFDEVQYPLGALKEIGSYPRFSDGFFEDVTFPENEEPNMKEKIQFVRDAAEDIPKKEGDKLVQLPRRVFNIIVRKPAKIS